jgi:hypothetical protein
MRNRGILISTPVGLALVGLLLVGSGCSSSTAKSAARNPSPTTTTTAAPPTTVEKPKPYDPSRPIDLGGEPGVTKAEQTRAETLLRNTIKDLPQFADPATAEAHGYRTIGDSITGDEHYVNWSYVNDGDILDPNKPESLVYEMKDNKKTLAAAMYMLPFGSGFGDVPDVGGALTQWHVHRDLCLTDDPVQKVVSTLTSIDGACPPHTTKAGDTPMLHVWIVPNACGPFAALEGVGAGQVPAGQTRLCDTGHGSTTAPS